MHRAVDDGDLALAATTLSIATAAFAGSTWHHLQLVLQQLLSACVVGLQPVALLRGPELVAVGVLPGLPAAPAALAARALAALALAAASTGGEQPQQRVLGRLLAAAGRLPRLLRRGRRLLPAGLPGLARRVR